MPREAEMLILGVAVQDRWISSRPMKIKPFNVCFSLFRIKVQMPASGGGHLWENLQESA